MINKKENTLKEVWFSRSISTQEKIQTLSQFSGKFKLVVADKVLNVNSLYVHFHSEICGIIKLSKLI